jgi:N-acetylneuraminic acid mutarotase
MTVNPAGVGWQAQDLLPTARTEVAAAELNGKIYVAGGYAADGSTLAVVEEYDSATNSWATVAPLPEGRNHLGIVAVGGRLYAVGGYSGSITASAATADVWAYDPPADTWSSVAL